MSTLTTNDRPESDIAEDVREFIRTYDPLKQSRPYFTIEVKQGVVTLKGNVASGIAYRVLADSLPDIEGVTKVDMSQLYHDDDLRLTLGKLVPPGINVRVSYGTVMLAGRLPEGIDGEALMEHVRAVPGVRRVAAKFF
jgi:osmotically-inducible protein OsmY